MMKKLQTSYGACMAALVCALLGFPVLGHAIEGERPNILVILADDLGYGDIGAYNPDAKIPTPHLDRLAAEGIRFTDAHAGGSTCKPSRYALMTGRFAARKSTLNDKAGPLIEEGRPTVPGALRRLGYRTAMVGKWHLGFDQNARPEGAKIEGFAFDYNNLSGGPVDRGFDSLFGMHASLDIPPYFYIRDRAAVEPPSETIADNDSVDGPEGWNHIQGAFWRGGAISPDFKPMEVTPRFIEEAIKVIEGRDRERPLFLYLALPSPHTPWLPTESFVGKSEAGMYGDFVAMVDDSVGKVLTSLDEAGIAENTLVLFSSDNGPVWYAKDEERFGHQATGVLRGCKGSVWEGGHRMPFIIRWPELVKGGQVTDHTVAFADVYATFADLAGMAGPPEDGAEDSVSFAGILRDPDAKHAPRPPILHGEKVIRDGDWKLIATKGGRGFNADKSVDYGLELYNLREDLSEQNNLIEAMPEKEAELRAKIAELLAK